MLESTSSQPLADYGMAAYDLLRDRASKRHACETVPGMGEGMPPAVSNSPSLSPMSKSLKDFRTFTDRMEAEREEFKVKVMRSSGGSLEQVEECVSSEVDARSHVARADYTPGKSSAMAEYIVAKHVVESSANELAGVTNSSYSLASPSPSPLCASPSRERYSPQKSDAMASYKVAREVVLSQEAREIESGDGDVKEDVSEADIDALKLEMEQLRSQLHGVASAVVTVAKEIDHVSPPQTKSLTSLPTAPSPFPEIEEVGDYSSAEESTSSHLIEEALRREMKGNEEDGDCSEECTDKEELSSSLGGSARDIPPPPPTPTPMSAATAAEDSFDDSMLPTTANAVDFRRSSLDHALATRDLESWGNSTHDDRKNDGAAGEKALTGMELTMKNIKFPKSSNEEEVEECLMSSRSLGATTNEERRAQASVTVEDDNASRRPPPPPPLAPLASVRTEVRSVEDKVKEVMRRARGGGNVSKALGLSVDETGWRSRTGGGSGAGNDDDDTLRSPQPRNREEKEAKEVRKGVRREERELMEERERFAMEERRQAFNEVFGKAGGPRVMPSTTTSAAAAPTRENGHLDYVHEERNSGLDVVGAAALAPTVSHDLGDWRRLRRDVSGSGRVEEDCEEDKERSLRRMKELEMQLPGGAFDAVVCGEIPPRDVNQVVAPPSVPLAPPRTPSSSLVGSPLPSSGVVLQMSPGVGTVRTRMGNYKRMRERRERRGKEAGGRGGGSERNDQLRRVAGTRKAARQVAVAGGAATTAARSGQGLNCFAKNSKSVRNAICNLCLAGKHMSLERSDVLARISSSIACGDGERFIVMLSEGACSLAYRGVYVVMGDGGSMRKVAGWGPIVVKDEWEGLKEFYRFDTGKKQFVRVKSRTFGGTVDAVSVEGGGKRRR